MIPTKYTVRNLRVRWITTLMTVVGTAIVVWSTVLTFGLVDAIEHALRISGGPLDLIAMREGATDETSSGIEQKIAREIATLPGIARDADGRPLASMEFVTILNKPRRGDGTRANLIVRGLEQQGRALRPEFTIVEGRDFRPGLYEAITSRRLGQRFENLGIGDQIEINQQLFTIVGYFEASGSSAESEVWTDLADLTAARKNQGAVSVVNFRAIDETAKQQLIDRVKNDEQFNLKVVDEPAFFEEQMSASLAMKVVAYFIAAFLTFGAMFAAANTMFAAVASRSREIGTLRALGFRRRSILSAFLLESILLCLMGGILGCLATLPLNGITTGTANWATFSELTFSFHFGPKILALGIALAVTMGILGGLFPALRAIRLNIVTALRET